MNAQHICASGDLRPSGPAVRFDVRDGTTRHGAFAIRFGARVYAYLNRCGHMNLELDWSPGEVFTRDGASLICATHGALYDPASGICRTGACAGVGLIPIEIVERRGEVLLLDERYRLESRD